MRLHVLDGYFWHMGKTGFEFAIRFKATRANVYFSWKCIASIVLLDRLAKIDTSHPLESSNTLLSVKFHWPSWFEMDWANTIYQRTNRKSVVNRRKYIFLHIRVASKSKSRRNFINEHPKRYKRFQIRAKKSKSILHKLLEVPIDMPFLLVCCHRLGH